jgi:predicted MFS family arabinose efflux permease
VAAPAIGVLAGVRFLAVTGETTPVGLLPEIAVGLGSSQNATGLTVSGYAFVAAVTAVPLTRWTSHLDRRTVLLAGLAVFAVGHVAAASASTMAVFAAGRAFAALGHGLLVAVAVPTAIRLARPGAHGRAGARVMAGSAAAMVVGTPLATLLGQTMGWRAALAAIVAATLLLAALAWWLVPPLLGPGRRCGGPRLVAVLCQLDVVTVLTATVALVAAHFAVFTYLAPYAGQRFGVHGSSFAGFLVGFGVAAVAASTVAGRLADARPRAATGAAAAGFVLTLIGVWLIPPLSTPLLAMGLLVLWGAAFAVLAVLVSLAVLRHGGPHTDAVNAVTGVTFQVGVVAGSALGAVVVAAGHTDLLPAAAAAGGGFVLLAVLCFGRAFGPAPPQLTTAATPPAPPATP